MYNISNKIVRLFCLCVFLFGHTSADAQNRNLPADINPYFGPVGKQTVMPNAAGFIQRWLLLEPISVPVKSNVVFTDSAKRKKVWDEDIRVYSGYGFKPVTLTKLMKMAWKVPQFIQAKFMK